MEGALAWVGQLAAWFGQFFPRWVILPTIGGAVKFQCRPRWLAFLTRRPAGLHVVVIEPGLHFYWPATTEFREWPTARQTANLNTQTFVTTDDRVASIGGVVAYEVRDLEKLVAHTYSPDDTIRDIASGAVYDACIGRTWAEVKEGMADGSLYVAMRRKIATELDTFGVRVIKVRVTDFAPCRVLKIVQATTKDGE